MRLGEKGILKAKKLRLGGISLFPGLKSESNEEIGKNEMS
jgi:hypothetical protein